MSAPTCSPMTVTTGRSAFLRAWRTTTTRSSRPLDLAVTTYSWRSTSSIADRVWRISTAAAPPAIVMVGMIMSRRFWRRFSVGGT